MKIKKAISELKKGSIILLYDSDEREKETDLVVAAQHTTCDHIHTMRHDGGGLICVATEYETAEKIGLPYTTQIYDVASKKYPILAKIKAEKLPYDERSAFSIMINHRQTFTGISDEDRSKTIREFAKLARNPNPEDFIKNFRSPGHVPLLIADPRLLEARQGQTELSIALMKLAGLTPVSVICEMLNKKTSLTKEKAKEYARKNNLTFIEGKNVIAEYKKWQK